MIILSTLDGARRFVSPAVQQIGGWSPEEFLGLTHLGGIHPEDRDLARTILASLANGKMNHTFRYRVVCKDGSFRWVEACVRGYRHSANDGVAGYVATIRDISAQKQTEESWLAERALLTQQNLHLADLALRDELTSIPNRRAFNQVFDHEAARHSRAGKPLALLIIDVDHFKLYNDRYGHLQGDFCLQRLARAFQACTGRVSDLVARVGGEEFAVLLPGTDETGGRRVGYKILEAVRSLDIEHADNSIGRISVSIGMAMWPSNYTTETSLLIQQADRALYESKRQGRNCLTVFEDHPSTSSSGQDSDAKRK